MTRRLLNLLTALSLLLGVAACALWVRSHLARDLLWWENERGGYAVDSSIGQLVLWRDRNPTPPPADAKPGWHYLADRPGDVSSTWPDGDSLAGRAAGWGFVASGRDNGWQAAVPHWFVLLLACALPAAAAWRAARRRPGGLRGAALRGCAWTSALLAVVVAVLWVRSYRVSEQVHRQMRGGGYWLSSSRGSFGIERSVLTGARHVQSPYRHIDTPATDVLRWPEYAPPAASRFGGGGFAWGTRVTYPSQRNTFFIAPYWSAMLLSAALPVGLVAVRFRRQIVRRRRAARGRCPGCGYDLRATPGTCPECGAIAAGDGSLLCPAPAAR